MVEKMQEEPTATAEPMEEEE